MTVPKIAEIDTELVQDRLSRVLRRFIGRGMCFEYAEASEILGVDQRTVESWVRGERAPHLDKMLRLALLPGVGTQILNSLIAISGHGGAYQSNGDSICPNGHLSESAARVSDLARALEDGRIDHQEAARLAPDFRDHGVQSIEFAAALEAGNVVPIKCEGKIR